MEYLHCFSINPKEYFMLKTETSSSLDTRMLSETEIEQVGGGFIWFIAIGAALAASACVNVNSNNGSGNNNGNGNGK
jgi:hypothetical protein